MLNNFRTYVTLDGTTKGRLPCFITATPTAIIVTRSAYITTAQVKKVSNVN